MRVVRGVMRVVKVGDEGCARGGDGSGEMDGMKVVMKVVKEVESLFLPQYPHDKRITIQQQKQSSVIK